MVRTRIYAWVTLYLALGLAWAAFARWVVPPMLAAEHPGPFAEALKRFLHVPPVVFLCQDLPGRWREFSMAVGIAIALHLTIVLILGWRDRGTDVRGPSRRMNLAPGILAAAFLAVAALLPIRQDYYFYLHMWYQVRDWEDPWFLVSGQNGLAPLNAYGPLFNPLAVLAWLNPVAPRLLFSYAYILFAIGMTHGFAAGRPPSGMRTLALLVLFWNPFPWVEVAFYGHFDLLIGLTCLGTVLALARGWDIRAGLCLAGGVLLKYLPIVLLPFLAMDRDRGRLRTRFLAVSVAAIAAGLAQGWLIWGSSMFLPMKLAATRPATTFSIFRFLNGPYSPLPRIGISMNFLELATPVLLAALAITWWWCRDRKPDVETTAVVVVLVLLIFYRVGYPQYQMVLFVLAAAWLLRNWDQLQGRTALVVAMGLYGTWITGCDVAYMLEEAWDVPVNWDSISYAAGFPTFVLGSVLLGCVVRAAPRQVASKDCL
jgi:hypothetical protein